MDGNGGVYEVGRFKLVSNFRQLFENDKPLHLREKTFEVLQFLIENRDRALSREDIKKAAWGPDTFIDDQVLSNSILELRKVLGREAIETCRGFGYRLTAAVRELDCTSLPSHLDEGDAQASELPTLSAEASVASPPEILSQQKFFPGLDFKPLWARLRDFLAAAIFLPIDTKRYLRHLIAQHSDFTFLSRGNPLSLNNIYINLKVGDFTPRTLLPDSLDTLEPKTPHGRTVDSLTALLLSRRLVILGDPGSGKTTMLKYLAVQIAKRDPRFATFALSLIPTGRNRLLKPLGTFLWPSSSTISRKTLPIWLTAIARLARYPLPIYLTLNHFGTSTDSLEEQIIAAFADLGMKYPKRLLLKRLAQGQCLLLLDALDEVVHTHARTRAVEEINRLRIAYGRGNQIIVTSRIAAFQDPLDAYLTLEVHEFTDAQIEAFAHRWFIDRAPEKPAADFIRALQRNPRMRLLGGNPLLLSLMALLYELNWKLPERRAELYQECVRLLTGDWDRVRRVNRVSSCSTDVKVHLLRHIAWQMHESHQSVIEEGELLTCITRSLEILHRYSPSPEPHTITKITPEELRDELLVHTGLLRRTSRSSYGFVHLTFQEFFTACQFAGCPPGQYRLGRGQGWLGGGPQSDLMTHLDDPWWREVIRLAAGLECHVEADLLNDFLHAVSRKDLLLAAGCITDIRPPNNETFPSTFSTWAEKIIRDLASLSRGHSAQQEAFDALAEVAVVCRSRISHTNSMSLFGDAVLGADKEKAVAAVVSLSRAADTNVFWSLLSALPQTMHRYANGLVEPDRLGHILRLLHNCLPHVSAELQARVLVTLARIGHPLEYIAGEDVEGGSKEYWIDKYFLTNAEFHNFAKVTQYKWTALGVFFQDHPIKIEWEDALAYCKWSGKRLPTDAELAKGPKGLMRSGRQRRGREWCASDRTKNYKGLLLRFRGVVSE